MWRSAVEEHGVKVCQPNQGGMGIKLIVTLVCNLIAALVLARVIHQVGHHMDLLRGLKIGAGVGLGFCATALTMTYVWQSPPRRLWANRYRLSYRRSHDGGCNPGGLAIVAFALRSRAGLLTIIRRARFNSLLYNLDPIRRNALPRWSWTCGNMFLRGDGRCFRFICTLR